MKKLMIAALLFTSCTTTKSTVQTYKVLDVKKVANNHSMIKAKGLEGWFEIPSDTLKKNDLITITWIRAASNFRKK